MARRLLYLGTLATAFLLSDLRVKAAVVDPGNVGSPAQLSFQASIDQLEAGEDITFPDLKHVEIFGTNLPISIGLAGGIPPFGIINPGQSGNLIYRYSDENGNTIGDIGGGTWSSNGTLTVTPGAIVNPSAPAPFIIHDLHIQFEGLGAAIDPDSTLLAATITWPGQSEVGLWVPEPSSATVLGGLAVVSLLFGRGRQRRN